MVGAVGAALVALLVDFDQCVDGRVDRLEVVKLVFAKPACRETLGGRVTLVENPVGWLCERWGCLGVH